LASLGRCSPLVGGGSAPLAIALVEVPRTAASYDHDGDQEGPQHSFEMSLTNYGAAAFFACVFYCSQLKA
jgi:hypothetical protein